MTGFESDRQPVDTIVQSRDPCLEPVDPPLEAVDLVAKLAAQREVQREDRADDRKGRDPGANVHFRHPSSVRRRPFDCQET